MPIIEKKTVEITISCDCEGCTSQKMVSDESLQSSGFIVCYMSTSPSSLFVEKIDLTLPDTHKKLSYQAKKTNAKPKYFCSVPCVQKTLNQSVTQFLGASSGSSTIIRQKL